MNLVEALENKIFDLPLAGAKYFPMYLEALFNKYIDILKTVDDDFAPIIDRDINQIEILCKELLEINNSFFKGTVSDAYSRFSVVIEKLESYLRYPNKNFQEAIPTSLFKARKVMEGKFSLLDMFHVPFEKRYNINTSRFSLSGVPCLYLSNSIYTCWEELDRPIFSQMPVSRFEISGRNLTFLDLSNKIGFIKDTLRMDIDQAPKTIGLEKAAELMNANKELIKDYIFPRFINTYPLYAACYIQVYNRTAHFKPEYIFPQMLMQWIMAQDDIDGIKYFSTKCSPAAHNLEDFYNYAIPVQSFQETGHCEKIANSFSLTEPLTFDLLNILDPVKASTKIDFNRDMKNKFHVPPIIFINITNKPTYYLHTSFGILEYELLNMPVQKLSGKT